MNKKLVGKNIILKQMLPSIENAEMIFNVVEKNRKHLRPWLPWEKLTKTSLDTLKFLLETVEKNKEIVYGIFVGSVYIGNIAIINISNSFEKPKQYGEIGYWLSKEYGGNGYMAEAVNLLEKESFKKLKLNRIQIRCDVDNIPSIKTAQKAGYSLDGELREIEYSKELNGFRSFLMFSKLKSELKK